MKVRLEGKLTDFKGFSANMQPRVAEIEVEAVPPDILDFRFGKEDADYLAKNFVLIPKPKPQEEECVQSEVVALNPKGNTYGCPHCGKPIRQDGDGRKVCPYYSSAFEHCELNRQPPKVSPVEWVELPKNKIPRFERERPFILSYYIDILIDAVRQLQQQLQKMRER